MGVARSQARFHLGWEYLRYRTFNYFPVPRLHLFWLDAIVDKEKRICILRLTFISMSSLNESFLDI